MSRKRGFTLITLLLVVAVMAVLSAILFPRIAAQESQPCTSDNCQMYQADGDV